MLTILNDPAGISGVRRYPLDRGISLQANIERHLSGGADAELRINGVLVDPLTDPRLDMPPSRHDLVTISLRPRGLDPITWAYIAIAALAVYAYAASQRPNVGDYSAGKDSPNNKLTGQRNIARAYQAVPDVYGRRRVWPDLTQPSTVEYIDQLKYVTEWLCVSRGKGLIEDVSYAETPIADIDGSSFAVFEPVAGADGYPENGSTTLTDVYETFESDEVNGQELPYAVAFAVLNKSGSFNALSGATTFTITIPDGSDLDDLKSLEPSGTAHVVFTYAGPTTFDQTCTVISHSTAGGNTTFTFSSTAWVGNQSGSTSFTITPNGSDKTSAGPFTLQVQCTQIWWNVIFLRGLKGSVTIRAEWWQVDEDGNEIGGTRQSQDDTFTADTYDQRFYTVKVTPAAGSGKYRTQFTRLTNQVSSDGADVAKLEEVYAVRHFATKVLPGVTIIRVTTKATLAATGFAERKFNLWWTRKVRTLTSDTLSTSRNFARTMAHIWTIAGNDIAGLDTDALASINAEHGEGSELLRFDGSLDDADMSLGERLQFVADTARCVVWRDGTKWTATRDQAQAYPEVQLDYRTLAAKGESQLTYSAHLPATFDGIELEYVDEASQSKKAYERWSIATGTPVAGTSSNPKKIKMPGCATQSQAQNRALLEARKLIHQRTRVTDTALSDAGSLRIGSLVRWVDPNDFGGDDLQAGEVLAIVGDSLRTSEPVNWGGATSGRMLFTAADGRRAGPPVVCYPNGDLVRLGIVPGGVFVADAERQCGSRYVFATGLTDAELEAAGLFTASEIKPASDGTVSLALIAYDSRIYAGDT
jgi:hypothetical protein